MEKRIVKTPGRCVGPGVGFLPQKRGEARVSYLTGPILYENLNRLFWLRILFPSLFLIALYRTNMSRVCRKRQHFVNNSKDFNSQIMNEKNRRSIAVNRSARNAAAAGHKKTPHKRGEARVSFALPGWYYMKIWIGLFIDQDFVSLSLSDCIISYKY